MQSSNLTGALEKKRRAGGGGTTDRPGQSVGWHIPGSGRGKDRFPPFKTDHTLEIHIESNLKSFAYSFVWISQFYVNKET